jgi:hypothetical protein
MPPGRSCRFRGANIPEFEHDPACAVVGRVRGAPSAPVEHVEMSEGDAACTDDESSWLCEFTPSQFFKCFSPFRISLLQVFFAADICPNESPAEWIADLLLPIEVVLRSW